MWSDHKSNNHQGARASRASVQPASAIVHQDLGTQAKPRNRLRASPTAHKRMKGGRTHPVYATMVKYMGTHLDRRHTELHDGPAVAGAPTRKAARPALTPEHARRTRPSRHTAQQHVMARQHMDMPHTQTRNRRTPCKAYALYFCATHTRPRRNPAKQTHSIFAPHTHIATVVATIVAVKSSLVVLSIIFMVIFIFIIIINATRGH